LKNALPQKEEKAKSPVLASFILSAVLLTIPLAYIVNSIAVVCFAVLAVFAALKQRGRITIVLVLPMLLYVLMLMSLIWSIDPPATIKALSKELPLLIMPLSFCFIRFNSDSRQNIVRNYSYGMAVYGAFYLVRAVIRYISTGDINVFFYHELVTKDVNAIYISAMFSVALFYFIGKKVKKLLDYALLLFMLMLIVMLSSKNIIVIDIFIIGIYYLFFAPFSKKTKAISIVLAVGAIIAIGSFTKIKDRIVAELQPHQRIIVAPDGVAVNNITVHDAYTLPKFSSNDYFNGSAFRVYQFRIFQEMLQEDNIMLTGYGLNAPLVKIKEKGAKYNVYKGNEAEEGYHMLNFHNQYIETFADIGIFGLIIFIIIQIFNLKNSFQSKDFIHIAFAILMISLFLTESLLCRQRGVVFFISFYCLFNVNYLSQSYTKRKI